MEPSLLRVVPGEGFEPSVEDPKSSALPLGHPGARHNTISQTARDPKAARVTLKGPVALGMEMRNVLLAALVLVTAACGAYHFPGGSTGTGTVTGQLTVIPCGPLERPQADFAPCKVAPAAGLVIEFASDAGALSSAKTGSDGRYKIDLPAGTYKVSVKNYMRFISGPPTVTVKAGATVVADYVLDSGIRTAVPQQ